jgi:hypothetical protein
MTGAITFMSISSLIMGVFIRMIAGAGGKEFVKLVVIFTLFFSLFHYHGRYIILANDTALIFLAGAIWMPQFLENVVWF